MCVSDVVGEVNVSCVKVVLGDAGMHDVCACVQKKGNMVYSCTRSTEGKKEGERERERERDRDSDRERERECCA